MIMKEFIDVFLAKGLKELHSGSWIIRLLKSGSMGKVLPLYGAQGKVILFNIQNEIAEANS